VYQQQKVKHQEHAKSTVNVEVKTKFLLVQPTKAN